MITKEEINLAMQACSKAEEVILAIYNSNDWDVSEKADKSPLTKADKAAHNIIVETLAKTGLPILSEEGKNIDYNERKSWKRFWLVDPLDGTKEFLKRNGEFTVNIALIENNVPTWGVVLAPVLNKTYYIDEHDKACLKTSAGVSELTGPLHEFNKERKGNKVVASRSHMDEKTKAFVESLNEPEIVSMGSSLKFMMLAEGKADVYPRFAPTSEWDTAAAHAILSALKIKVQKEESNEELQYNKENVLNPGFMAYSISKLIL